MATPPSVEALADMFPTLSMPTILDVVDQCGNNYETAMEQMLAMTAGANSPRPAPLGTRRGSAVVVPPQCPSCASASKANHAACSHAALSTPIKLNPAVSGADNLNEALNPDGIYPWLDTGQGPGALPSRVASRSWWPQWPLAPAGTPCKHSAPQEVPGAGWAASDSALNENTYGTPDYSPPASLRSAAHTGPQGSLSDDDELVAMLPHLAHCLAASPSLSGTSSPSLLHHAAAAAPAAPGGQTTDAAAAAAEHVARLQFGEEPGGASPRHDGAYSAADLVQAVEFHAAMFPNLKTEVVADVLQRYADAPQTALDQLAMLSSCVEDAAAGGAVLPDPNSWDLGSGSDDEHGRPGASWEQAVTAQQPAQLGLAMFPQASQRPLSPEGNNSLPAEEKEQVLAASFPAAGAIQVAQVLRSCGGSLFEAAELLRAIVEGDRAKALHASTAGAAAAPASDPAPAAPGSDAKVLHLAERFPDAAVESVEVALQSCSYDLTAACRTLRQAGYREAATAAVPAPAPTAPTLSPTAPPPPMPLPRPLPVGAPSAPPPAPLSLSEASYQRNHAIFEEERSKERRLQEAYRKCFALAAEHHARGQHGPASDLRQQGQRFRAQYEEERRRASRRISTRVNASTSGALPVIPVDLHSLYTDAALEMVESGIRNLPESIPGGVVVRYITGRGRHSADGQAKIKPRVVALLAERGVPYVEGPGWVEATLVPAVH